jgi:vancomycin resistance protein VanJ
LKSHRRIPQTQQAPQRENFRNPPAFPALRRNGEQSSSFFSRFAIVYTLWIASWVILRLIILSVERFSFPPEERAMHTIIDWRGHRMHIFIVHLTANNLLQQSLSGVPALTTERFGHRTFQVQRIREETAGIDEPVLVLCDCNMLDTSAAYVEMAAVFTDSFRESGWGSGHTSISPYLPFPYQRIDYIWHSGEFISVNAYVGENQSSDHYPVIATFSLLTPRK